MQAASRQRRYFQLAEGAAFPLGAADDGFNGLFLWLAVIFLDNDALYTTMANRCHLLKGADIYIDLYLKEMLIAMSFQYYHSFLISQK